MGRWYHEIIELREILKTVLPEYCLAQVRASDQPVVPIIWEVVRYRSGGHLSELKINSEADLIEHLDTRNWLAVVKKLWGVAFYDLGRKNPSALSYVAILLYTLNETTGHDRNHSSSYDNGASWETAYRFSDMTVNLLALIETPTAQEILPKAIDIRQKLMNARISDDVFGDDNGDSGEVQTDGIKPALTLVVEDGDTEVDGDTQNEETTYQNLKKLCIEITSPQLQQAYYEVKQQGKLIVGRSSRSEIKLSDPMVSRRHIELELTAQGQLKLTPISETNSTTLNGRRLTKHETIIWEIGQYVVIGNTRLDLYWG